MTHTLTFRLGWTPMLALAVACGGSNAPKVPLTSAGATASAPAIEAAHALIGPAAQAALDSGNVLFRRKAYAEALVKYRAASELAPQHSAPLFGIYMVAGAMGNKVLADSALAGIRVRNGPLPAMQPGSSHAMADSALNAHKEQMKKPAKSG
jgi:hypothetical protein